MKYLNISKQAAISGWKKGALVGAMGGLLWACSLAASAAVAVGTTYFSQYSISTSLASPGITDIIMVESTGPAGVDVATSFTHSYSAAGFGATTVLDNSFPRTTPILRSFLMGVVSNLPGDAQGQQHLVLMIDPAAALNMNGIAWGTIFNTTLEENIIDAVTELGRYGGGEPTPEVLAAVNTVYSFADGAATTARVGFNGAPGSIWFDTGSTFSIVAFSTGQTIGQGLSQVIAAPVPEPASWALMGGGVLMLGWLKSRQRKQG